MERISKSADGMPEACDVVVVGSGYGGGVAAMRCAEAGHDVCVLERGREILPGEYPRTPWQILGEFQVNSAAFSIGHSTALFDLHVSSDISVLVGCGLGGSSLINANVAIPAETDVRKDPRWPSLLQAPGALDEGLRRARSVLDPQRYPKSPPTLKRVRVLTAAARSLRADVEQPPLFVNFRKEGHNGSGVHMHRCVQCGNCNSGCNFSAKSTVLMNYLPRAYRHGARIYSEVAVTCVARNGHGWTVHYTRRDPEGEGAEGSIRAARVILAAGVLGSTEILLRSGSEDLRLSDRLGGGFSGNGDVLGFAYDGRRICNSVGWQHGLRPLRRPRRRGRRPVGPAISTMLLSKHPDTEQDVRIEDNTWPGPIAGAMPEFLPFAAALGGVPTGSGLLRRIRRWWHELESIVLGPRHGAVARSLALLGMTGDDAAGTVKLTTEPDSRGLGIEWHGAGSAENVKRVQDTMLEVARRMGADFVPNPIGTHWFNQSSITTHPLGGCAMGETVAEGVVDHLGRVFNAGAGGGLHKGLYVLDGSIIPTALGANPALTIAAIAERNVAALLKDDKELGWHGSLDGPCAEPPRRLPHTVGLQFRESLAGWVFPVEDGDNAPDRISTFLAAVGDGRLGGGGLRYELLVTSHDVMATIADPKHAFNVAGHVEAPTVETGPLSVTHGTLELFVPDDARTGTVNLRYSLVLRSTRGAGYRLEGFKVVHDGPWTGLWRETNTLYVTVRRGVAPDGPVVARGVIYRTFFDFLRGLITQRALHARTRREGFRAVLGFEWFFLRSLFDTYGGFLAPTTAFDPSAPASVGRRVSPRPAPAGTPTGARRCVRGKEYPFRAGGVELRLTRYHRGGERGPVLLTHGLGASSLSFTCDSVETNLVEYLMRKGHDVWLLDYRASIDLPSSDDQFTADDVAKHDYPRAVAKVLGVTGAGKLSVVAHCFGATTFLMSLLRDGGLHPKVIRSAVCSQNGYFVSQPFLTRLKAGMHLELMFRLLRIFLPTVRATKQDRLRTRLVDFLLRLYPVPTGESCHSEVCHRATAIFGLLYNHENLDRATHDGLGELFGEANLGALMQLAAITRAGHLVDAHGGSVYDNPERLRFPLSFIHGATNRCYLPESTKRTYDWLVARNGAHYYDRRVFPGYGHIDCIFGRNAAKDVFPYIDQRLV